MRHKESIRTGLTDQIENAAKAMLNLMGEGIRLDHAIAMVKKDAGLNAHSFGLSVEKVQRSMGVFNWQNNKHVLNGIGIDQINKEWNTNLKLFLNNEYAHHSFYLGDANRILNAVGINGIIRLKTETLRSKINTHPELKGYEVLKNLPSNLNRFFMLFKSTSKGFVLVTQVETKAGLKVVILNLYNVGKHVEINISSIHARRNSQLEKWMQDGLLMAVNKKSYQDLPHFSQASIARSLTTVVDNWTKIDNYLVNPKYLTKNLGNPLLINAAKQVIPMVTAAYISKKMEGMGAVEVLSQNQNKRGDAISFDGKHIQFNGYLPSYQILSNYDHLINGHEGTSQFLGDFVSMEPVFWHIKEVTKEGLPHVVKLAQHLYDSNPHQAAFNIWHFCKMNMGYALENDELLRLPARSWADRKNPKLDCDDYSIFCAAILKNMGFNPVFKVVGFNGKNYFQHIYVTCKGLVLDPVMDSFGIDPKNITKMKTFALRGLDDVETTTGNATWVAEQLRQRKANLMLKDDSSSQKELTIVDFVLSHEGKPSFNGYANVMHLIKEVTPKGKFFWKKSIEEFTEDELNLIDSASQAVELGEIYDEADYQVLEGLGRRSNLTAVERKRIQAQKKEARKKLAKQRVAERKEAGKMLTKGQKVGAAFARFEPLMVTGRNSFLAILALNFRGLATNMSWGVLTDEILRKNGLNDAQIKKVRAAWTNLSKKWAMMGGNPGKLRDAIKKGMHKKPLFGAGKKGKAKRPKTLKGLGQMPSEIADVLSMQGLGLAPPAIAAAAAAAAAVIGALVPVIKTITNAAGKKEVPMEDSESSDYYEEDDYNEEEYEE